MTDVGFRFLHAADFHLEQPFSGLLELPESIANHVVEAPFAAALKVFDAAIRERVEFIVLSGDLLDVEQAGAAGVAFLLEQFERMEASGIAVYWCGGRSDNPQEWPAGVKLPSGTQVFPAFKAEELTHFRDEEPIALIVGRSWHRSADISPLDFPDEGSGVFTVGVGYGTCEPALLMQRRVDYWALGGEHARRTVGSTQKVIHYPGTTQSREPSEIGPHGCSLVHVASEGRSRIQTLPTDTVRWLDETLLVAGELGKGDTPKAISDRVKQLRSENEERLLLVRWKLRGSGKMGSTHKRRELAAELLSYARTEFASGKSPVWSVGVDIDAAEIPATWYEEDSMLGEFLRVGSRWQQDDVTPDLTPEIPEAFREHELATLLSVSDESREQVLSEAVVLGSQLLGGNERSKRSTPASRE